jgi:hypothetical protein
MLNIAHIINPVKINHDSDLQVAQPITFETMKIAKNFARKNIKVHQYAAFFSGDQKIIPKGFKKTRALERSFLDIKNPKVKRKLPFIKDILDRLYEESKAEFFIYTNVDIALMPHFYITVQKIIEQGYDAFIIFRRTLSKKYNSVSQLPLIYADYGEYHPGHDCFVFKREFYKKFLLGDACVGAKLIARVVMSNIIAYSSKYEEFKNLHLTFHIGDDRIWDNPDSNEYYYHNVCELMKILKTLIKRDDLLCRNKLLDFVKFNVAQIRKDACNYPDKDYLKDVPSINDILSW